MKNDSNICVRVIKHGKWHSLCFHIPQYVISRAWWASAACLRHGCLAYIISWSISATQWPSERLFTSSAVWRMSLCHRTFCGQSGKPQRTDRLRSSLSISTGGIYFRDDVMLLVLMLNTMYVLYLNKHSRSPLFLQERRVWRNLLKAEVC